MAKLRLILAQWPCVLLALFLLSLLTGPALPKRAWVDSNYDEWFVLQTALKLPEQGFNPKRFDWPSLVFEQEAAFIGGVVAVGHIMGRFEGLEGFKRWYYEHPEALMKLSRGMMLVTWALTVSLVGLMLMNASLGLRLYATATICTLPMLVSVCPLLLPEAPMVLFSMAGLFLARLPGLCRKKTVLMGLFLGMAVSAKYPAVICLFGAFGFILGAPLTRAEKVRRVFIAGAASLLGFFLTSPYALLDPATFLYWLKWQMNHTQSQGHAGFENAAFGVMTLRGLVTGFGPMVIAAAFITAASLQSKRLRPPALALLLGLLYFMNLKLFHEKYLLALLPLFVVLAVDLLSFDHQARWRKGLLAAFLCTLPFGLYRAWANAAPIPDEHWLTWAQAPRITSRDRIGLDHYLPPPPVSKTVWADLARQDPNNQRAAWLSKHAPPGGYFSFRAPLDAMAASHSKSLIRWAKRERLTLFAVNAQYLPRLARRYKAPAAFHHWLKQHPVEASFGDQVTGITVYRLRPTPRTSP